MTEKETNVSIELLINGKRVGLNPYVTSVFVNVIRGLVDTLKNVGEPTDIEIRLSERR